MKSFVAALAVWYWWIGQPLLFARHLATLVAALAGPALVQALHLAGQAPLRLAEWHMAGDFIHLGDALVLARRPRCGLGLAARRAVPAQRKLEKDFKPIQENSTYPR